MLRIVCGVAPGVAVALEGVVGEVVVVLAVLYEFLQVFVHELLPELLVEVAHGFVVPSEVLDELLDLKVRHVYPEVAGRVGFEVGAVLLVAKAPVEVPYRTEDVLAGVCLEALAVAEGALRVIEFEVADKLINHEEAHQLLDIDVARDVLPLVERLHEAVEVVLYHLQRQGGCAFGKLWFLDVDG